jgi:hypothetical protein
LSAFQERAMPMVNPPAASNPGPREPLTTPAHPPTPPEGTPSDPIDVPPLGPDVIFPADEPVGVPPAPDILPSTEPPARM